MNTTFRLAELLIPVVFAAAVLCFVHGALLPLLLPLLLIAAGAIGWRLWNSSGKPRS